MGWGRAKRTSCIVVGEGGGKEDDIDYSSRKLAEKPTRRSKEGVSERQYRLTEALCLLSFIL